MKSLSIVLLLICLVGIGCDGNTTSKKCVVNTVSVTGQRGYTHMFTSISYYKVTKNAIHVQTYDTSFTIRDKDVMEEFLSAFRVWSGDE